MLKFYKQSNSQVTEAENIVKKTQQNCKKLAIYFGFEESKKWEEILIIFQMFREKLIKTVRELRVKQEKEKRKASQNEKKNQLAAKLAKQPPKEQLANVITTVDLDGDGGGKAKSAKRESSKAGKAQSMYADYLKNKKSSQPASNKNMWV